LISATVNKRTWYIEAVNKIIKRKVDITEHWITDKKGKIALPYPEGVKTDPRLVESF